MTYAGNCRLGDLFTSRREKGRSGLPTLSVTLNDGLVNREDLDRKQETSLAPEEHLLVKPGDIAYNMMRMWQGAFGLADREGLVSPAYVVLKPNAKISSRYMQYLFETKRMAYLFWAYSYGITDDRLRLYFDDFRLIPVSIPSSEEQARFVEAIGTWDKAITLAKRLVDSNLAVKRALIRDLASGRYRIGPFREPWEERRLGDICAFARGCTYESDSYAETPSSHAFLTLKSIEKGGGYNTCGLKFLEEKVDERFSVKSGDLLCAITDVTRDAPVVGAPLLIPDFLDAYDQIAYSMDLVKLTASQTVRGAFLYFHLQTPEVRKKVRALASGSTVLHLDVHGFKKLWVRVPRQHAEQDQIIRTLQLAEAHERLSRDFLARLMWERQAFLQSFCGKGRAAPKRPLACGHK